MRVSNSIKLQSIILPSVAAVLLVSLPANAQVGFNTTNNTTRSVATPSGNTFIHPRFGTVITGRPVGTATSESPAYYGSSAVWGLGGVPLGTPGSVNPAGAVGQFGYYNNAGVGYYTANPMMPQYPVYPAPVALGENYFAFGGLSSRLGYWRAPSGYYYPWCPPVYLPGVVYPAAAPIYMMDQGAISAANPPVGLIINDMRLFIEDAKSKRQLDQSNYENIFNSLNEITARAADLGAKSGGKLNATDDTNIRRDLDVLAAQIARSLNP
jgi:hypothetical protein